MQGRRWCFTHHLTDPETMPELPDFGRYLVYGWERCPTTGSPHLQGYLETNTPVRMSRLQAWLPHTSFFHAKSSSEKNATYCKKDGDWVEYGEAAAQGARSDLLSVKRAIDDGASDATLWEDHFANMTRYHKAFVVYKRIKAPVRNWKTKVFLVIGPPGKGKSTVCSLLARYISPGSVYVIPESKSSGLYFDGYDGQETVILDEMDGTRMKPTLFNLIADEHEASVPVTGAPAVAWYPRYLFVISNYAPRYWWKKRTDAQLLQTTRRIDCVFKLLNPLIPLPPPQPKVLVLNRFPPLPTNKMTFHL